MEVLGDETDRVNVREVGRVVFQFSSSSALTCVYLWSPFLASLGVVEPQIDADEHRWRWLATRRTASLPERCRVVFQFSSLSALMCVHLRFSLLGVPVVVESQLDAHERSWRSFGVDLSTAVNAVQVGG